MKSICAAFSRKLVQSGAVKPGNEDIYAYGLEVVFSAVCDILIMLAIGLIFNKLVEVAIYFMMLVFVRRFTGGYHAKTHLGCKTISLLMVLIVLFMSKSLENSITHTTIAFAFSGIIAIFTVFSPVPNENKTLSESQLKNSKFFSIALSFVGLIICRATYSDYPWLSSLILITFAVIAVMMLPPIIIDKIKNKGGLIT